MAPALMAALERRACRRWRHHEASAALACRIRPGHDAAVVDVSASGVLLETRRRLVPGGVVEVQLDVGGRRTVARAHVVRCGIAVLRADVVVYRGALRFDAPIAVGELA